MDMKLEATSAGFTLSINGRPILNHSAANPCIFVGRGHDRIAMHRGRFEIEDRLIERCPLAHAEIDDERIMLAPGKGQAPRLILRSEGDAIALQAIDPSINRLWIRIAADADEHVWGGGEQFSYFDLRGRRFPLWSSEPGVGRDKTTEITFKADATDKAGGDYYHTYYPQPTYLSSARYALHVSTSAYCAFDFRDEAFHELEVWAVPERIELFAASSFIELVEMLSDRFGRQPPLPEWILGGAIIGLKDGANSFERLERMRAAGVKVAGLWCEDWVGVRPTAFGARLFWNWQANAQRYPGLRQRIAELNAEGIRFLGYVNPYLCDDGSLFPEAKAADYFVKDGAGETALIDFGEFRCGIVDFTNEAAAAWFSEAIIGTKMLDYGLSGWMADFGEYLPTDVRLANGVDARLMHNKWPTLWAEVNAKAVASRGKIGEVLFFMRAGFTGVQRHCPLLWAGDQSVDFSRHDGLVTVICAALSSGLLGNAFHHSDIGGYTSLFGNVRTRELLMRWAEMAAFTPVMRSHEGNRPRDNVQLDDDAEVLRHFARMTAIYVHLAPYLRTLSQEAARRGLPVQRPLFLHHEADRRTYTIQDSYLYGPDMLVAPVWQPSQQERKLYLPAGTAWVHVWTGQPFTGGEDVAVSAPLGQPAVFYRSDSAFAALFSALRDV
jgi:alpha-glucosidase